MGFDWNLVSEVWRTGVAGSACPALFQNGERNLSRRWRICAKRDIAGSGFAITGYAVHSALGGDASLARLRGRPPNAGSATDA